MAEEKDKPTVKDQETVEPASGKEELSEKDLDKTAGGSARRSGDWGTLDTPTP